jgi:pimeloyl-ACP methyl ester carboxylesterase
MPFAQLSSIRQHYYEHGHGPRAVVFVHGFQASARIFQLVWERMPEELYRCIAVNNRGAGESDAPPEESAYGAKPFADDLYELVKLLGLREIVMVGHSMGGLTVMQFAVEHPELLHALVLIDPAGPDGIAPEVTDVEAAVNARISARAAAGPVVRETREEVPEEFLAALAVELASAPEQRLRGSYRSMLTSRIGDRVARLTVPVLMLAGDNDQVVQLPRLIDTFQKLPPGSSLHVWHGVGHSPNVEVPERLTRVVRRFIEKTVPARLTKETAAPA